MTRLFASGAPIEVWLESAQPVRFRWQGQAHHVMSIVNCWRVDAGWWRLRVNRDYFKVYTDTGLLVELYQDRLTDSWFLQRIYD
jgi:hypothetical protein